MVIANTSRNEQYYNPPPVTGITIQLCLLRVPKDYNSVANVINAKVLHSDLMRAT